MNRLSADHDRIVFAEFVANLVEGVEHLFADRFLAEISGRFIEEFRRRRLFPCGNFCGDIGRFHQQILDLHVFVVAMSQEGIVRSVFQ